MSLFMISIIFKPFKNHILICHSQIHLLHTKDKKVFYYY